MIKKCSRCKKEKSIDDFYYNSGWCKLCEKEYRSQNKEKYNKIYKKYYNKNKDKYKENSRKWQEKNKEKLNESRKKYYKDNKEKFKNYNKKWREKNKLEIKSRNYLKKYNVDYNFIESLFDKQSRKCAICEKEMEINTKEFHVDHCHKTKKVRGILCNKCNIGLGCFDDNIGKMSNAINYIKSQ